MHGNNFTHFSRRRIGRILISILLGGPVLLVASCSDDPLTDEQKPIEPGNGMIVSDTVKGQAFSSVSVRGLPLGWVTVKCTSVLHQRDSCSSIVRIDENIRRKHLSHYVSVWNPELTISLEPTADTKPNPTVFEADMGCPNLRQLSVMTSNCDFSSGFVLDSSLFIHSMLGGSIVGKLMAPELKISMSISYLLLTGETEHLDITSRQCTIDLQDFAARNVVISCEERSVVKVSCDDTLRVVGRTRSKIYYKGTPRKLIVDLDSTSTLEQM